MQTSFSTADRRDILGMLPALEPVISDLEMQRLERLRESHGVETDKYLEEVMRLYKIHMLGVVERTSTRSRATGGRKFGAHSMNKHR